MTTKQNPVGQGAVRLAEVAEQQSKGRVKVDVFDAGQLGGELDMVSQIRLGSLDMAIIGSGIVASVEPTFSITELPFIWKSDDSARKVLDGPTGRKILGLLEVKGIKPLAWGEWGFRGILTTKRPIEAPDDLKGLKIPGHRESVVRHDPARLRCQCGPHGVARGLHRPRAGDDQRRGHELCGHV